MERQKIQMPYKVTYEHPNGSPTYNPKTRRVRAWVSRYFSTREEAVKFCGNPRRVFFAPGEAWRWADDTQQPSG